jgi:hypothetical protein
MQMLPDAEIAHDLQILVFFLRGLQILVEALPFQLQKSI